jgi:hypothetical protein
LKNNDGLLANHIAKAEKTTYEVAVSAIENDVISWKNSLQKEGSMELKNIGLFSLNSEGSLVFTPSEQLNYLTDSFGLSSFVTPFIKREIYKEELAQLEERDPIVLVTRKSRHYLKYAAILIVALTATGSLGLKLYSDKVETDTLLVQQAVQKQVENNIQEATFFIQNPLPSVTLTVKEETMPYHVVSGVFRVEENAENAYQDLIERGYKARRIAPNKHGLFPVLYGSFPTYTEAQHARTEIQKSENPEAWLLIEEL